MIFDIKNHNDINSHEYDQSSLDFPFFEITWAYNGLSYGSHLDGWIINSSTIDYMIEQIHWFVNYKSLLLDWIWSIETSTSYHCFVIGIRDI